MKRQRHYTGNSRTSKWRHHKIRRDAGLSSDSSDESETEDHAAGEVQVLVSDGDNSDECAQHNSFDSARPNNSPHKDNDEASFSSSPNPTASDCADLFTAAEESDNQKLLASKQVTDFSIKDNNEAIRSSVVNPEPEESDQHSRSDLPMSWPTDTTEEFEAGGEDHEITSSSDSCSSDGEESYLSEDLCSDSCIAYYLDEDQEEIGEENQRLDVQQGGLHNQHNPDNPDDPDNPGDPGSDSDHSTSDESDEEDNMAQPANLMNNELRMEVELHFHRTKGEVILLELASAIRHKKTFESVLDSFRNLNELFGDKCFPESKPKLWNVINLNRCGMRSYVYCGRQGCGAYLGRKVRLRDIVRCQCGYECEKKKAKFFVTLDFERQLQTFLLIPGMWEKLQYPRTRQKRSATAIEDIFDASEYKRLQEEGGFLSNPNNLTFTFNLDGCKATKKGTLKIWPCYARINELPPELRQKFAFVVAVFVDHCDPNFHTFLKPIVRQFNRLSTRGITWSPNENNQITTQLAPLCACVDAPARAGMMHMSLYNAAYGCTLCTHRGIRMEGSQRFPIINLDGIPEFAERTHDSMVAGMITAQQFLIDGDENQVPFQGHKGTSPLLLLQHHDLRTGQAVDDLHQDHEGCAADITNLLLTMAPRIPVGTPYIELVRQIDLRLLQFKTPSRLSRKPRTIGKRNKYNGSEWRNWLLFYAVPCLTDLIELEYVNMMATLSHGCYLLSQDAIEENDIVRADRLLRQYARNFEETFRVHRLKYNLHVTTSHKVTSVRQLGPPYCYSTYNFESLNCKLTKFVTSPKGAAVQILTRSLLNLIVHSAQYDQRFPESIRERLHDMLNKERLHDVREVGPNMYMVGKSVEREATAAEANVLEMEGFPGILNFHEYNSVLIGSTRYRSVHGQNPDIKSNDTCLYTEDETYCTIQRVIRFTPPNGEETSGLIVLEHAVDHNHPIAQHLSILDPNGDLLHFIQLNRVRCPAVVMTVGNVKYVASIPNCLEID